MRIRTKLIIIFTVFVILFLLYKIYRYEIFVWSCEREQTVSSCMLAGQVMEERGESQTAIRHYDDACSKDYGIGCFRLSLLYRKLGRNEEAGKLEERACKLGYDPICKNQEKR